MSSNDDNLVLPLLQPAALKTQWAAYNIDAISSYMALYTEKAILTELTEPDANGIQHFVVNSKIVNPLLPAQIGDVARSLRAALDHFVSAVYRANGLRDDKVYFPIGDNRQSLEATIKGGLVKYGFPDIGRFILDEIEPTKAAQSPIWSLNQIDRANKHRTVLLTSQIIVAPHPNWRVPGGGLGFHNTVEIQPGTQFKSPWGAPKDAWLEDEDNFKPSLKVSFGPGEAFAGLEVVPVLSDLYKLIVRNLKKLQKLYVSIYGQETAFSNI